MPNSLATNLNQVLAESSFLTADSYIGNTTQDTAQIVAIAQAVAMETIEDNWQAIRKNASFTLTSATTYTLPSDYLEFISGTAYTQGRWDPVDMATTDQIWALMKSVTSVASLPVRARIIANQLNILNPTAASVIQIEYTSNAPITNASGTVAKKLFSSDTDLWVLDDRMFQLEVKWRFKREKGLEWQTDLQDASNRRATVRGRDTAQGTILPNQLAISGVPYTNLWVTQ